MIWIWIAAAIGLSVLLLRRKHISLENYIWALLPVDMYGINLAGVTVKPYMLFSVILAAHVLIKRQGKLYIGGGRNASIALILLAALIVNMFNGGGDASIMAILMVILVYLCACLYASNIDESIHEIPDAIIATSIGYGLVFVAAYILFSAGVSLPGLTAETRMDPGIFMRFTNMYRGSLVQTYRLRGFNIDPNPSVGVFLPALSIDLIVLLLRQGRDWRYVFSLVLSIACIVLTNSRMGILAAVIVMLFSGGYALSKMPSGRRLRMATALVGLLLLLVALDVFTTLGERSTAGLLSIYSNRSGFRDEYGRASIWREAVSIWVEQDLLLGVGTGQMQYLTHTGRSCHNTWLSWLCESGLPVGSAVLFYFLGLLWSGFKSRNCMIDEARTLYQTLLMGLFGMVWCLFTVDNITNSYLWFFAVTLIKGTSLLGRNDGSVSRITA